MPLLRQRCGSRGPSARRLPAAAALSLMCLCSVVAGCTSARNALGTNSSPCFLALPVAKDAVHGRGTFGGVRIDTAKDLAKHVHLLRVLTARAGGKLHDVCVVEYRGSYRLDQVQRPIGRAPDDGVGRYAIVVVSRTSNLLLGTFVRSTLPVRFRHLATGQMQAPRAPRSRHQLALGGGSSDSGGSMRVGPSYLGSHPPPATGRGIARTR